MAAHTNSSPGTNGAGPSRASTGTVREAWLIGGGISSLAAAVHLIHDAHIPPSRIHILEGGAIPGGTMASEPRSGEKKGYIVRAARKLNFTYHCLYDTLSRIPVDAEDGEDGKDGPKTLLDRVRKFSCEPADRDRTEARLVSSTADGRPEIVDTSTMGLSPRNQADLMALILRSEESLGSGTIRSFFDDIGFFETNFWDMFSTMYLFKPWHSAVEFRRYLHRFLHEFPNISTLAGIEYMPCNDFEAAIMPMVRYLKEKGVEFRHGVMVSELEFVSGTKDIIVSEIKFERDKVQDSITVRPDDIVLVTLGSMTSSSRPGSNTTPPPPLQSISWLHDHPDPVWKFWLRLADPALNPNASEFGKPELFRGNIQESAGLAFTVTLWESSFIDHLLTWAGSAHGTCPLITFRDCPWLLSITIPRQPYFADQDEKTTVFWGYGIYPDQSGRFVNKPMMQCSGVEILTEILRLVDFPLSPTLEQSATLPVLMPFVTSPYMTRTPGSRPKVVPKGSKNLGLMGQYVEMERDVTFTMEYSVRSAQTAVYQLMGLDKKPPDVYGEDPTAVVLGEALKTLMV